MSSVLQTTAAKTIGIFSANQVLRAAPADANAQYAAYLAQLPTPEGQAAFLAELAGSPDVLAALRLDSQVRRAIGYAKRREIGEKHFASPHTELALLREVFPEAELARALASKGAAADRAFSSETGISDHAFFFDAHGDVVVALRLSIYKNGQNWDDDDFIAGAAVHFAADNTVKSSTVFATEAAYQKGFGAFTKEAP